MADPTHPVQTAPSGALCTACGLCCDGTLFIEARIDPGERDRAAALGLPLIRDGSAFRIPCDKLRGRRCSIYGQRPAVCAAFRCRLLERLEDGAVPVSDAMERVATARAMVEEVRRALPAGCSVADARAQARHFVDEGKAHPTNRLGPDALVRSTALMLFLDRHFRRAGKTDLIEDSMPPVGDDETHC